MDENKRSDKISTDILQTHYQHWPPGIIYNTDQSLATLRHSEHIHFGYILIAAVDNDTCDTNKSLNFQEQLRVDNTVDIQ